LRKDGVSLAVRRSFLRKHRRGSPTWNDVQLAAHAAVIMDERV
jgi:hypothetical protein